MILAGLTVHYQFDKDRDGNAREEYWGVFKFVSLPRVGDVIDVWHGHDFESVRVKHTVHYAVPEPLPSSELPSLQRKEPHAVITADWCALVN